VQSVLTQTLRHSGSLAEAKISFSGRIRALAAAHDILTREHWGPVEFRQLLLSVTAPYGSPDRFAFEGPNVKLDPSAAVSVAMLLNELATNALQYGALSLGTGSVAVSWKIESGSSDPILDIQWKERGGPAVTVPQKKGFGMRLIEAGFSGQARVEFATEGLTCSIVVPLQ
jgi:two-component sensor histidine kinase